MLNSNLLTTESRFEAYNDALQSPINRETYTRCMMTCDMDQGTFSYYSYEDIIDEMDRLIDLME